MNQFSVDDEAAGHAAMLARIRAEQIRHEPEPGHEPSWVEDRQLCDPAPHRVWCCEWHKLHPEVCGRA